MTEPLVTIAIPTRNRRNYLEIAINSAVNQSYSHIEILVSDNASDDGTAEMLTGIQDPRVRSWTQQANLGMAGNWNFLLEKARGQYFCLLSDDDFLKPQFIARLVESLEGHPETAFAYSGCEIADGISTFTFAGYPLREPGLVLMEEMLKGSRTIFLCSMLFPTQSLLRTGGFPNFRFSADSGAWMPLLFTGDVAHDPQILSHYTAQTGSISANIPMADIIGDLERLVSICASDPRATPVLQKRFASIGRKMLAKKASRLFLHRAALGTQKSTLIRSLPSLSRFLSYDILRAFPAVASALLMPPALMRRLKSSFRQKREEARPITNPTA